MGLPQVQDAGSSGPTPQEKPTRPSLPPEAIELATKLFDFARQGKTPELEQYVTAGIPVNLTNGKGDTLLMLAAYHGHLSTVQMLLGKGADVNSLNDRGQSIIAGTVFKGYDEVAKELAQKGADLTAGQPNAIDTARMFKREDLLRFFGVADAAAV